MPKPASPAPRAIAMLTIADVADELHLSEKTIHRRIKEGALRVHRLGRAIRITREDLNAFVQHHRA